MAAVRSRRSVEIDAFSGLVNKLDPTDIPPGYALDQVNVTCVVEAELSTRGGYLPVSFEA